MARILSAVMTVISLAGCGAVPLASLTPYPVQTIDSCVQLERYTEDTVLPRWVLAEDYLANGVASNPGYADHWAAEYGRAMAHGARLGCLPEHQAPLPVPRVPGLR